MTGHPSEIPLRVLIVDADDEATLTLAHTLEIEPVVLSVNVSHLPADHREVEAADVNTIFIDPLSVGLDAAADFIFGVRKNLPTVVFVLYVDKSEVEEHRSEFYRGERRRLAHYFSLDKRTPLAAFSPEVRALTRSCQNEISMNMSAATLSKLREEAHRLREHAPAEQPGYLDEVDKIIHRLSPEPAETFAVRANTVFVSHRFAEQEYVSGLSKLLLQHGFEPVTGESANTYVSKAVLDRIKESEFFLCLMTRDQEKNDGTFTTSAWLLEEKGAALAFGKALVLMIEDGVSDFGGLQGDWQRIHFAPKGFLNAAFDAVAQLKSYAGGG